MKQYYSYLLVTLFLTIPTSIYAQNNLNQADELLNGVGSRAGAGDVELAGAVGSAISIILSLVGLIFLVLMVYAGVLWLTARGEESQVDKSRKIIASTIIGLILTISAYSITFLVTSRLGS